MSERAAPWRDLGQRVVSAVVMIAVALFALWSGQGAWTLLVFVAFAAMIWELSALCDPQISSSNRLAIAPLALIYPLMAFGTAYLFGAAVAEPAPGLKPGSMFAGNIGPIIGLAAPLVGGLLVLRAGHLLWLTYGAMLGFAGLFLIHAYRAYEVAGVAALVAIVVLSDTGGYFAGRALGGPKFWPRVSPKKTWSGTVAGWVLAGIFGLVVLPRFDLSPLAGAAVAVALCLAAQFGDIAESAMKRRVGVKDASALIPGHGGVLDRLDGLVAAASLAAILLLATGG